MRCVPRVMIDFAATEMESGAGESAACKRRWNRQAWSKNNRRNKCHRASCGRGVVQVSVRPAKKTSGCSGGCLWSEAMVLQRLPSQRATAYTCGQASKMWVHVAIVEEHWGWRHWAFCRGLPNVRSRAWKPPEYNWWEDREGVSNRQWRTRQPTIASALGMKGSERSVQAARYTSSLSGLGGKRVGWEGVGV